MLCKYGFGGGAKMETLIDVETPKIIYRKILDNKLFIGCEIKTNTLYSLNIFDADRIVVVKGAELNENMLLFYVLEEETVLVTHEIVIEMK